jgi:hypothetical protein
MVTTEGLLHITQAPVFEPFMNDARYKAAWGGRELSEKRVGLNSLNSLNSHFRASGTVRKGL